MRRGPGRWVAPSLALASIALGSLGVVCRAAMNETRKLEIRRRVVRLPRLSDAFHGYRILHISDLHVGGWAPGLDHVRTAQSIGADLIVVTGDLIDHDRDRESCASALGALHAPDGVWCVLGNHDHAATRCVGGVHRFTNDLARRGVRTLRNGASPICRGRERLWLVGVDDPYEWRVDLVQAYNGIPEGAPSILLAHSPDVLAFLPPGRADLVLAGHCHGGQIRTPLGAVVTRTRRRYPDVLGLQRIDGTLTHLSGGVGSTIPLRLLCPPEVTVLHIVAGAHAQTR